jgi:hypothetical protein
MCDNEELELRLGVIEDIEAVKKLKAKYWRCADNKLWDELAECFTGDATLEYGKINPRGRDAIIDFLRDSTGNQDIVTIHQGYNPEIEITGADTARGIWALHDYIVFGSRMSINGWGYYYDEYVKQDGKWRKKSTKITRLREEWNTVK